MLNLCTDTHIILCVVLSSSVACYCTQRHRLLCIIQHRRIIIILLLYKSTVVDIIVFFSSENDFDSNLYAATPLYYNYYTVCMHIIILLLRVDHFATAAWTAAVDAAETSPVTRRSIVMIFSDPSATKWFTSQYRICRRLPGGTDIVASLKTKLTFQL